MDFLVEDSREEKLIEDYLFSGYRPSIHKSAFELDQQFAKPIVDEDIFGVAEDDIIDHDADQGDLLQQPVSSQNDDRSLPFDRDTLGIVDSDILGGKTLDSPGKIFEDESNDIENPQPEAEKPAFSTNIDEIFLDDYSNTGSPGNIENAQPKTYQTSRQLPPPPPSPAQLRIQRLKQEILKQAKAMNAPPKNLGSDCNEDGTIELLVERSQMVSNTNSKFLFTKLFDQSKIAVENSGTPERKKKSWSLFKESLRKEICAQKRKVWNSFQPTNDMYDDEEEMIENKSPVESPEPIYNEDDDGGIEAIDREEISSNAGDEHNVYRRKDRVIDESEEEMEQDEEDRDENFDGDDENALDDDDENQEYDQESDDDLGEQDAADFDERELDADDEEVGGAKSPAEAGKETGDSGNVDEIQDDHAEETHQEQNLAEVDDDYVSEGSDNFDDIGDDEEDFGAQESEDSDDGAVKYRLDLETDSNSERHVIQGTRRKLIVESDEDE